jgi:peptidoglycan LD-endopeptidase LytH
MPKIAEIVKGIWQQLDPIELKRAWLEPRGWWPFDTLNDLGSNLYGGGYGEDRDVYLGPQFGGANPRTVHLGFDVFAPENSAVFCPQDGEIIMLHDNKLAYDYGPTLIIQHDNHLALYGHLSRFIFENLKIGQTLSAGEFIGPLGHRLENGGWPAHVHVQIINELPSGASDFPGVCAANEFDYFRSLCPDPAPFLGL